MTGLPPKPAPRPSRSLPWDYLRRFRRDILSAQPQHLYRAWMADLRLPFFRSLFCNDPSLIEHVLKKKHKDFPKSNRVREGLVPLLGNSVFLTNGTEWAHQRRIIDPAFAGGRLKDTFPAMLAAAQAARARLAPGGWIEVEAAMSHATADVIFRTLFSIPIEDAQAKAVFEAFKTYQRSQPLLNLAAFLPIPNWVPRFHRPAVRRNAAHIRRLIADLVAQRAEQIAAGTAPDDLATKIMTATDPETGARFNRQEMVDQVAIFFLAGHETSASALAWTLYLLATHPRAQARVRAEARALPDCPRFSDLSTLAFTRDVFREALRLYPPVPMMVRQNTKPEVFRDRPIAPGAQIVISPWHVQRHEILWDNPDAFDPERWGREETRICARDAYLPFSAGPRVCPGAGFAMIEGPLILAHLLRDLEVRADANRMPIPVAHLTVRARDGIYLKFQSVPR